MSDSDLDLLVPEKTALILIDMQNAFCHDEGTLGVSGVDVKPAQATIEPVRRLAEAFRAAGLPVIWTKQVHLERDASRARKVLPSHTSKRKRVSAVSGTWDAALVDELAPLADDPTYVVTKHRFGAFYETRLQSLLDMLGVRGLFVAGVTANACVETTLREAYLRDYDVVAVTDGIAAVRPDWTATAEAVWAHYLGKLATSDDVLSWLERGSRPQALNVHHLLMETVDLDRSVAFYTDVLGFSVRKREDFRDGRRLVVTHQGLGLTEGGTGQGGTLQHLCFTARDIDGLAERARAAGHRIVRGPGPGPYGHTVYVADPDGHEIELVDLSKP
ncbi:MULTISPECIES: isochorismatase family protein [Actinomadura]|uniref:Isochorismatase family protein n=1 Tax=Actinomadura yumaensis TaxID=111807 RepID=A0ABW2CXJ2_9ACTN|nr:isochorismatase family protein [Actinomadura sp. J1-007]MWK34182.1 isochorismatase family protein [Actinomadura sp. J1-007]